MSKLTEPMIIARTKCSDLNSIKNLNCWGNDLSDVSLVQRMPNVEVLALSVNNISTLADFQFCNKLRELYLRKNNIRSLNEVCYLQVLPHLRNLTLTENPCSDVEYYRLSVVKALPRLEKLDDQEVSEEERRNAVRQGRDLVHPEDGDEVSQSEWATPPQHHLTDTTTYYNDPRVSNGLPAEAEQCWEEELQEENTAELASQNAAALAAAAAAVTVAATTSSCGQNFETAKVSPVNTPPGMESPEPPRNYQDEYADRRNANYENTRISPSEQIGYNRHTAPISYHQQSHYQQCSAPVQYQQNSPTYYAQTPTSPESHAPSIRRRHENHSPDLHPCTPPSPSTPPFPQANGGSPSEHERGPRCRADGESRLCSELSLYACGHQDEEYYRTSQQQQPRHRFTVQPSHAMHAAIPPNARRKSRTSNILSAVLCLLKELDYQSLEVVDTTVNARMNELMHEHTA